MTQSESVFKTKRRQKESWGGYEMMKRHRLGLLAAAIVGLLATSDRLADAGDDSKKGKGLGIEAVAVNDQSSFYVDVTVDHENHVYQVGDTLTAFVKSEREGFLYLFYEQADGQILCLFPNKLQADNRIPAEQEIVVPAPNANFRLRVGPPIGKEALMAVVTPTPLDFDTLGIQAPPQGQYATPVKVQGLQQGVQQQVLVDMGDWAEDTVVITTTDRPVKEKTRKIETTHVAQQDVMQTESQMPVPTQDQEQAQKQRDEASQVVQIAPKPVPVKPERKKRLMLVVVINEYQDEFIRDLRTPVSDGQQFFELMVNFGQVDAEQSIILADEEATYQNIHNAFQELVSRSKPGDDILVFWSGHGMQAADDEDGDEADGLDEFLVPSDAVYGTIDEIRKTMISDDVMGHWIADFDGRNVAVVVDACHCGGLPEDKNKSLQRGPKRIVNFDFCQGEIERMRKLGQNSKDISQHDAAVLCSSQGSEISKERRQGDLSVMTFYLIECMRKNRGVTLSDAFDYVTPRVLQYIDNEYPGASQIPALINVDLSSQFHLKMKQEQF
jgi:hypothetical protein